MYLLLSRFPKIVFTIQISCEMRVGGRLSLLHSFAHRPSFVCEFLDTVTMFSLAREQTSAASCTSHPSVCCCMMQNVTIGGGCVSQPHRQCEVLSLSLSYSVTLLFCQQILWTKTIACYQPEQMFD